MWQCNDQGESDKQWSKETLILVLIEHVNILWRIWMNVVTLLWNLVCL
jgi:hypothetical protein